jgi:hypothetical protein
LVTINEDDGVSDEEDKSSDGDVPLSEMKRLAEEKARRLAEEKAVVASKSDSSAKKNVALARKLELSGSEFSGQEDDDDEDDDEDEDEDEEEEEDALEERKPASKKARVMAVYAPPVYDEFSDNETNEVQGTSAVIAGEYTATLTILQEVFRSFTHVESFVSYDILSSKGQDLVPLYGVHRKTKVSICLDVESGVREFGVLNKYLDIDVNHYAKVAKVLSKAEVTNAIA